MARVLRRGRASSPRRSRPRCSSRCAPPARPATSSTAGPGTTSSSSRSARSSRSASPTTPCAGVVATDALIGTFADMNAESLVQNRCFLYHLVGNGTGEWRVPVGGMGAVTDALAVAARDAGGDDRHRRRRQPASSPTATAATSPGTTASPRAPPPATGCWPTSRPGCCRCCSARSPGERPEGSQLKVNLLLDRLPRLKSGETPKNAFAGTFHVAEDYSELQQAYAEAEAGDAAHPAARRALLPLADRPLDPRPAGRRRACTR